MNYCQDQLKKKKRDSPSEILQTIGYKEDTTYLEMNEAIASLSTAEQRGDEDEQFTEVTIDAKGIINPVKIEFVAYPNYLNGSVSLQVK